VHEAVCGSVLGCEYGCAEGVGEIERMRECVGIWRVDLEREGLCRDTGDEEGDVYDYKGTQRFVQHCMAGSVG
jgi:hypothetical protein